MDQEQVAAVVAGEKKGGWILTFTGRQFWPEDPDPNDVCIEDIAHALSLICRFTGHCSRFYSVAEHSLLVTENLPNKFKAYGLLHDAAEAYVADVASPLKRSNAMSLYREIEDSVLSCIFARFELGEWMPPAVKVADMRALMTERRDLMSHDGPLWDVKAEPFMAKIQGWVPESTEARFLKMARAWGLE